MKTDIDFLEAARAFCREKGFNNVALIQQAMMRAHSLGLEWENRYDADQAQRQYDEANNAFILQGHGI